MKSGFEIFFTNNFKEFSQPLQEGMVLELIKDPWHRSHYLDSITSICIAHPDFDEYASAIEVIFTDYYMFEKEKIKNDFTIQQLLKYKNTAATLTGLPQIISSMVFADITPVIEENNIKFLIEKTYDTNQLFQYWLVKNTCTNNSETQQIGLGTGMYNLVPPNHNYFDICWICSCGMMGCYSYLSWYIRNGNSYTVGFVVNHYSKLDFDVKELNNSLTPFEEVIAERDKILQHNKRYQEIDEMPVADYNEEEPLNENDAAIWKEGQKFGIFSYIFDNEKAVLYKPFLHRNEDFDILKYLL